jgi:hypothetical protein
MTDLRATIHIEYVIELPDDVTEEYLMTEAEAEDALIEELMLDRDDTTIERINVERELLEDDD